MRIIPIFLYNIGYFLQFITRIVLLAVFHQEDAMDGPYTRSRVSIFGVTAIVIISLCIVMMLLQLFYKSMKQRRNDFLARYAIE